MRRWQTSLAGPVLQRNVLWVQDGVIRWVGKRALGTRGWHIGCCMDREQGLIESSVSIRQGRIENSERLPLKLVHQDRSCWDRLGLFNHCSAENDFCLSGGYHHSDATDDMFWVWEMVPCISVVAMQRKEVPIKMPLHLLLVNLARRSPS